VAELTKGRIVLGKIASLGCYGRHNPPCAVSDGSPCTCGLEATLKDALESAWALAAEEQAPTLKDKPAHMSRALEWIERNQPGGIALVARAFAETYQRTGTPPAATWCSLCSTPYAAIGACSVVGCALYGGRRP
jgi:hypothetical protein